jgi:hypothetical protein
MNKNASLFVFLYHILFHLQLQMMKYKKNFNFVVKRLFQRNYETRPDSEQVYELLKV